jgi:hypothetical protein
MDCSSKGSPVGHPWPASSFLSHAETLTRQMGTHKIQMTRAMGIPRGLLPTAMSGPSLLSNTGISLSMLSIWMGYSRFLRFDKKQFERAKPQIAGEITSLAWPHFAE